MGVGEVKTKWTLNVTQRLAHLQCGLLKREKQKSLGNRYYHIRTQILGLNGCNQLIPKVRDVEVSDDKGTDLVQENVIGSRTNVEEC